METLISDARYAIRDLLSAKGFSIVAIVTLALGTGARTAMFTVINSLLLRPLPFAAPDRLVALGQFDIRRATGEAANGNLSYPDFTDIRTRSSALESAAAYHGNELTTVRDREAGTLEGRLDYWRKHCGHEALVSH